MYILLARGFSRGARLARIISRCNFLSRNEEPRARVCLAVSELEMIDDGITRAKFAGIAPAGNFGRDGNKTALLGRVARGRYRFGFLAAG